MAEPRRAGGRRYSIGPVVEKVELCGIRGRFVDIEHATGAQTRRIVAWSIAAIASMAAFVFFGVPARR